MAFPQKATQPLKSFLDLASGIKKEHCGNIKRLKTLKFDQIKKNPCIYFP